MAGSIGLVAFNTHGNHHVKIVKLALADNDNIFYLDQCEGKIIVLPHYCNFKTLNLSASLHPMASAINKEELLLSFETIKKIINIPGALLELGVYKGCSLIRFAIFRKILENCY